MRKRQAYQPEPVEEGGRTINTTIKVTPEMDRELEDIAKNERRSRSQVGYLLLERALKLYRVDGQLVDPAPKEERSRPRIVR